MRNDAMLAPAIASFGHQAGNAWYDDAIVKSDEVVAAAIDQLGLRPFPKS